MCCWYTPPPPHTKNNNQPGGRGVDVIVNDWSAFVGLDTTSTEIRVIENIFRLSGGGGTGWSDDSRVKL
jgi:hypothetical protein